MGDFYQHGTITTFHNLVNRPVAALEAELLEFAQKSPISLILPCLYSELETDAMHTIVAELAQVKYLDEIVIGLDRANETQWQYAKQFFAQLPQRTRILWQDGSRLQAMDAELAKESLAPIEYGKGRNVWYCLGYVFGCRLERSVALHDCDIKTYDRGLLARLVYPIANPRFNYRFCKGFYARVEGDRLKGRVTRLLVSPLLRALKRTLGYTDYLEYMDSFRYPLAGEFALSSHIIEGLRIPSDWGLEIGILSEIRRNHAPHRICQAEIADIYDHKHQQLAAADVKAGLYKMSIDITKALYRKLASQGHIFTSETFRTVKATYYRLALDMVEAYQSDALMNGLQFDLHAEEEAVEAFTESIMKAGDMFLSNPMETPFITSWGRVQSAIPEFIERFHAAVELDNAV